MAFTPPSLRCVRKPRKNHLRITHRLLLLPRAVLALRIILDDLPLRVSRLPPPARGERRRHVEAREGVCLGVEDDLVQGEEVVRREEEVKVL